MGETINHPLCGCASIVIQKNYLSVYNKVVQAILQKGKVIYGEERTCTRTYKMDVQISYVSNYSTKDKCSLVYKGRKVALYGGAYAPSYLPNDVDTFTCGVNCGNHQIHHPPLIVKVHFFPCVQIAGNFFDLFRADGIHT